jgi:hypothetical protein
MVRTAIPTPIAGWSMFCPPVNGMGAVVLITGPPGLTDKDGFEVVVADATADTAEVTEADEDDLVEAGKAVDDSGVDEEE